MTVTGGFTGVGGRWEADAKSFQSATGAGPGKFDELAQLVKQARSEGVFGKDLSSAASGGTPQAMPDAQRYDVEIDGEHIRWNEPPPGGAAAAPPVVQSIKNWVIDNTERQPYRRH
jgi:hypothetical protein